TITTNSQTASAKNAEDRAKEIVSGMPLSIIKDRPDGYKGASLEGNPVLNNIYITGTSIEKAGGLYRVRATATKGMVIQ
ncbi:hypothetical protein EBS02_07165, partial [bacterium]|nr:hypothetical protein [bacterium]